LPLLWKPEGSLLEFLRSVMPCPFCRGVGREKLQAFSLFTSFGYRYNGTVTRSDLIQI
jgi:hypothetical protein